MLRWRVLVERFESRGGLRAVQCVAVRHGHHTPCASFTAPIDRYSTFLFTFQVDEIGEVTVTNDGATILKELEVEHPAARTLVELAERQDREVGDGTTSVVILAAELLKVRVYLPTLIRLCFSMTFASPCSEAMSSSARRSTPPASSQAIASHGRRR